MTDGARVLRIIARLNIGGPARHVTLLDAGLRQRGFDTFLLYGDPAEGEGSLEYLVRELGVPAARVEGLGREISPTGDLRAFVALVRFVFVRKPDIVHTHTAKAGTLGRLAATLYNMTRRRTRRCVIVHTYHGHVFEGYFGKLGSALARTTERVLAQCTDQIVTISQQQRHDIVERFRIAPYRKTVVVPLGLNLGPMLALGPPSGDLKRGQGFPEEAVVFGFIGRFVPIKDLPTLLHATRRAVDADPTIHLLLVGDGPGRAGIEGLVEQLALRDHVLLAGWRHDLGVVYGAIDVGVLSSRNEGTPVAVIEAMAAGRPVVATDVGGVRDVVQAGVTGLLVPPGDPEALASAMLHLARSSSLRAALGQEGRRVAADCFSTSRLVSDISSLYRDCLAAKRGTPTAATAPTITSPQ